MPSGPMAPSNAQSGRNVDPTLRPDSRLAFQHQVRQTYGTHGTQGIIFADGRLVRRNRRQSRRVLDLKLSGRESPASESVTAGVA